MTRKLPLNTKKKLKKKKLKKRRVRNLDDEAKRSMRMKPRRAMVGDKGAWK